MLGNEIRRMQRNVLLLHLGVVAQDTALINHGLDLRQGGRREHCRPGL